MIFENTVRFAHLMVKTMTEEKRKELLSSIPDKYDESKPTMKKYILIEFLENIELTDKAKRHRKIKYKGTDIDGWKWDIEKLKKLSKQELYDICLICKG